jgi:hypothetical protein
MQMVRVKEHSTSCAPHLEGCIRTMCFQSIPSVTAGPSPAFSQQTVPNAGLHCHWLVM